MKENECNDVLDQIDTEIEQHEILEEQVQKTEALNSDLKQTFEKSLHELMAVSSKTSKLKQSQKSYEQQFKDEIEQLQEELMNYEREIAEKKMFQQELLSNLTMQKKL